MFNKIGIRTKLIGTMLCVCLIPLSIVGYISQLEAAQALEKQAFNQLETVREVKKAHIEHYFETIRHQVLTFSENRMIVEAMQEFHTAFDNLSKELDHTPQSLKRYQSEIANYYSGSFGVEYAAKNGTNVSVSDLVPDNPNAILAQYLYIADNPNPLGSKESLDYATDSSSYSKLHAKYHPIIRTFLQKFGYYDIFLISPDKGEIVYSVFKEIDYATSLKTGPYSSTNFASVFQRALAAGKSDAIELIDFEPYLPSYHSPASFVSAPIYEDDDLVGVLIFQMPVATVDGIMQENAGLGETGETYLVGKDGLMRSQSRFSEANTILAHEVRTEATDAIDAGRVGSATITNYDGDEALSSFAPVEIEGLAWGVIAEIDTAEALGSVASLKAVIGYVMVGGFVLALTLGFLSGTFLYKQLGTEPATLLKVADAVANDNFDIEIDTGKTLSGVFAGMVGMLQKLKTAQEESSKRTGRIQEALDKATGHIMVTDENLKIIYVNAAARRLFGGAENDIRHVYPSFDSNNIIGLDADLIYDGTNQRRDELLHMTVAKEEEFVFGNRLFGVNANPVMNPQGQMIGTVMEWEDRTQITAIQKEVQSIVNAALKGNLTKRINLENKDGFFESLSRGVNDLVAISEKVIEETICVLSAMSRGNLNEVIHSDYEGAFGELKRDANTTVEKLTSVVGQIQLAAKKVKSGADEISHGNADLNNRTEQQATNLGKTASSMEELTSTVKQNAHNAAEADQLAKDVREKAEKGGVVVKQAVSAMSEINNSSRKISDIIGVIDDIAFQTNLLALNAAVEAARAGDQGRGFAVVASEVRNLAGRSATAAKEIKDLIQDSSLKVNDGSDLVNKSGETLEEIIKGVNKVTDLVGEIAAASQEQSIGLDHINTSIAEIDVLTQQNATLVEESTASSRFLGEQASGLGQLVSFFNTEESVDFETPDYRMPQSPMPGNLTSGNLTPGNLTSGDDIPDDLLDELVMPKRVVSTDQDWEEF